MNHQSAGHWGRICTSVVALVACTTLTVACSKSDDNDPGAKPDPGTSSGKTDTADHSDLKHAKGPVTGEEPKVKADWDTVGKLAMQSARAAAPGTVVDPTTISKDGLHKPIAGMRFKETGFRVAYSKSKNKLHDQFRIAFQKEGVFEAIATELNSSLKMTKTVDIQLVDCGQVNAFYDPNNSRVIVCYEIMGYFMNMFKPVSKTPDELGTSVVGATFFAFFHELGHALRDTLNLPVTGKEEDAVDQLATLILIQGGDTGVAAALAGARWFALQHEANKKKGAVEMPFWDEHSLSAQRFYNIACLIYGSDPSKYENLVKNKYLPRERALKCNEEFRNIKGAWEMILAKHTRTGGMRGMGSGQPTVAANSKPVAVPAAPVPTGAAEPAAVADKPETATTKSAPPPATPPATKQKPTAKQKPTTKRKPAPAASGAGQISCTAVAQKVVQLFVVYAAQQANPKTAAERQLVQQQIAGRVPALMQSAVDTCEHKPWTQPQRRCVMKAATLKAADRCDKAR